MIKNHRKSRYNVPSCLINAANDLEEIARGNKELIKDEVYKGEFIENGEKKYEVRILLKEIYYNKCAYCEIKEYKPEIEHYRPKNKVTGEKRHNGYYWLCYEWSNLLPSCRYCNTEGGKGNRFPVKGNRVFLPVFAANGRLDKDKCKADQSPLKDELPFLLHPEIDEPKDFFKFKKNGGMEGKDHGLRGKETIKIYNLNRDNLLYRRQKVIDNIKEKIQDALIVFFDENQAGDYLKRTLRQIFKRMEEAAMPSKEFSLMTWYCFEHFETMIAPLMTTPVQEAFIIEAFNAYKAGNL